MSHVIVVVLFGFLIYWMVGGDDEDTRPKEVWELTQQEREQKARVNCRVALRYSAIYPDSVNIEKAFVAPNGNDLAVFASGTMKNKLNMDVRFKGVCSIDRNTLDATVVSID